jgi:hypothetical protein
VFVFFRLGHAFVECLCILTLATWAPLFLI